jgi:DegV family protein with EDD domain
MNPLPSTGTPSAGTFESVYQSILDQGAQSIISIHVASALSGVYSTAKLAAQNFNDRIHVIDSESMSMGLGFQAIAASETAHQTDSIEKITQQIELVRRKTRLFAMLDTLEYVHRSGRVSWARARIGSLLRLKPFVEVNNGKVLSMGQTRTRRKGIAHLKDLLYNQGALKALAILHTNAETDAIKFLDDLQGDLPADPFIINVTTIIGTHVGPKGLGFAAVLKS